jgi:hypothetical protein
MVMVVWCSVMGLGSLGKGWVVEWLLIGRVWRVEWGVVELCEAWGVAVWWCFFFFFELWVW